MTTEIKLSKTNQAIHRYDRHGELAMLARLSESFVTSQQHEQWANDGILESLGGTILRHNDGEYRFGPNGEVKRPALMSDQNRITLNIMNEQPFLPIVLDESMPAPCQEWLQSSGLANGALKIRATGKMPQYMVEQLTEQASLVDVMGIVSYLHFEGDHVLRPSDAHDYISQFVQMVKQEALASPNYDIRIRALVNMNGQQMNSLLSLCEETLDSDWKISPDIDRQYLLSKAHALNHIMVLTPPNE